MSEILVVPADFLASELAPRRCLFTGRTDHVRQEPIIVMRGALPPEAENRPQSPRELVALARNRPPVRPRDYGERLQAMDKLPGRFASDQQIILPLSPAGHWHNRVPILSAIGILLILVAAVAIGIVLFTEPAPEIQAAAMGQPRPTKPAEPQAISPRSPGALVLYAAVAIGLVLLVVWRQSVVRVTTTFGNTVTIWFPSTHLETYQAYHLAYAQYCAAPVVEAVAPAADGLDGGRGR